MSGRVSLECTTCGWSGDRTKSASGIDLCPECLSTSVEEVDG